MRSQVFVQEQHLLEAVRRKVITEEQMQQVLSLARSMGQRSGAPDLSWLTVVQSVVVAGIALGPVIPAMQRLHHGHAAESLVYSVIAVAGLLTAAHLIRRFGLGKAPAGIAAAGAALWCFGFGVSIVGTVVHPDAFRSDYGYWLNAAVDYSTRQQQMQFGYLMGDLTMLLGAMAIGIVGRFPATASAGALAVLLGFVHASEWFARANHGHVSKDEASVLLMGATIVLLGAGALLRRATRHSRFDPSFWVHTVGIMPLGVAGIMMIDREAAMTLPWLAVAICVVGAGVYFDRKSFIVAGAAAMLFYLPFGAAEARLGETGVGLAFSVAAMMVAATVLIVRKIYTVRATRDSDELEQTVWS